MILHLCPLIDGFALKLHFGWRFSQKWETMRMNMLIYQKMMVNINMGKLISVYTSSHSKMEI